MSISCLFGLLSYLVARWSISWARPRKDNWSGWFRESEGRDEDADTKARKSKKSSTYSHDFHSTIKTGPYRFRLSSTKILAFQMVDFIAGNLSKSSGSGHCEPSDAISLVALRLRRR